MASARGRPSAAAAQRGNTELPVYQPPAHPLNLAAQSAIRDLPRSHKLDSLKGRLKAANQHLTATAAEINDRYQEKHVQNERRKARRAAAVSSQESNEEEERAIEEMRTATEGMTERLEAGVRKVIDSGEEVRGVEEALRELNANITAGRGVIAPTQSTLGASQFRPGKRQRSDDEEGEKDEEAGEGAVEALKGKIVEHRTVYQASSMTDRYASHNDYVGFKKIVHDAHYPDEEAPPMPHASTWFGEEGGIQSSSNNAPRGTQPDSDDDLIMASERISVNCPLTLRPMKEPVSSTKCPHNFEKQAILEMISNSDVRVGGDGGRGREKVMRCPVGGCDVILSAADLHEDPVLVRKIKRIQAARRARDEPDYDEDDRASRVQRKQEAPHDMEITSSAPVSSFRKSLAQLKAERMSQAPNPREVSMVPNTQIVDEGDDDEVEEEEDDEEEEE